MQNPDCYGTTQNYLVIFQTLGNGQEPQALTSQTSAQDEEKVGKRRKVMERLFKKSKVGELI